MLLVKGGNAGKNGGRIFGGQGIDVIPVEKVELDAGEGEEETAETMKKS